MRSAARRVEEKFMGEFEKKGRVVLWTNSAIGCRVMGAGIAQLRSHCHISKVPRMWQRRMLYGRQLGTRSTPPLEEGEDKLMRMQRKKGAEQRASKRLEKHSERRDGSTAQRGRSTAKQCMVRRTGKCSKREREQCAHREEKRSKRGG